MNVYEITAYPRRTFLSGGNVTLADENLLYFTLTKRYCLMQTAMKGEFL